MTSDRIRVLFVDDDENLLNGMKRLLRKEFDVEVALGAVEGLRALDKSGPFSIVVSDQNMPRVNGAMFLSKVREAFPDIVRLMLTGNNDQGTAAKACNEAHVYRFLTKPINFEELKSALNEAHSVHLSMTGERRVLEETVQGSVKMLSDILSMAYPEAFRRTQIVQVWAGQSVKALEIKDGWQLKIAAMLWPLPDAMSPPKLVKRRDQGEALTEEEIKLLLDNARASSRMLSSIPRLQEVAKLILLSSSWNQKRLNSLKAGPKARLLQILIDLAKTVDPTKPDQLDPAFEKLKSSKIQYDEIWMEALPAVLKNAASETKDVSSKMMTVPLFDLQVGDLLMEDLRDDKGRLLLAVGQKMTDTIGSVLSRMQSGGSVSNKVKVVRKLNVVLETG